MGLEAVCNVRYKRRSSQGKALLETSELIFRGEFRLKIPFSDIKSYEAKRGDLIVRFSAGVATFELGKQAEKWALKIRYPKGLLDKLGVKPDSRVCVLGAGDARFLDDLRQRSDSVAVGRRCKDADIAFLGASAQAELRRLAPLIASIKRDGAIWVVYPKGRREITEAQVMAAGKAAGLVDTKIVSFSDTHSALKLVIPLAAR
jgi:hypothetical protein